MKMINRLSEKAVTAAVEAVEWERVTIFMDVRVESHDSEVRENELRFYAVDSGYHVKAVFGSRQIASGLVRLSLNISNTGECAALPPEKYYIYVCRRDEILARCLTAPEIVPKMNDYSRSFLYGNRENGYFWNFFVSETGEDLPFLIHVSHMKKSSMDPLENGGFLHSVLKNVLIEIKQNIGKTVWRRYYQIKRKQYKNKSENNVLFLTEQGDILGENLLAVMDRMKKMGLDRQYHIMTSARPASYIGQKFRSTKNLLKKIAGAHTIYLDDHVPLFEWLILDKETTIVQLWHAGAGFKSAGYSRWGHLGCPAPMSCHRQYKYGIAGSGQIGIFFAEVFGINEEQILPTGMPRMDSYLDPEYRKQKENELYAQYPMCRGKKVILFAPTYRGKNRSDAYYPYDRIDFDRLYQFCADSYVVLFKMHPWVKEKVPVSAEYQDRFADVGAYANINDLFYITDILITDYSSNIFEFSLMRKPMLFFAFDKIQYSFSRGFHRDYEEAAPGKVCYDFDSLMTALEKKDYEYEKVECYIKKHFDHIDSDASKRVIEWTLLGQLPPEIRRDIEDRKKQMEEMKQLDFTSLSD